MHIGGYSRGQVKTQVALRDGFSTSASVLGWHSWDCNLTDPHSSRVTGKSVLVRRGQGDCAGTGSLEESGGFGLARHLQPGACSRDRACSAAGVKLEPVSYRRVLPFVSPDVAGSAGLMIGLGSWGRRRGGAAAVVTGHAGVLPSPVDRQTHISRPGVYQIGPSGSSVQVNGEGGAR